MKRPRGPIVSPRGSRPGLLAVLVLAAGCGCSRWRPVASPTTEPIHRVWATGRDTAWAIAGNQDLLRWDGEAWRPVAVGLRGAELLDGWASGPDDVWLVGEDATIRHWDGRTWRDRAKGLRPHRFLAVHGTGPHDVWVIGWIHGPDSVLTESVALRWDGKAWRTALRWPDEGLEDIWCAGPSDVWVVGSEAGPLRWDGRSWSPVPVRGDAGFFPFARVWAGAPDDVWAAGDTLHRWDGTSWGRVPIQASYHDGIGGTGPGDVWIVSGGPELELGPYLTFGETGVVHHWDGTSWTSEEVGDHVLRDVWAVGPGDVWAVGDGGAILRRSE